jgi:bis(5'-nucleosyl)-tetraphosphatase (symmetrical)
LNANKRTPIFVLPALDNQSVRNGPKFACTILLKTFLAQLDEYAMTTYAIGPVRGELHTLLKLLDAIQFDRTQDSLCFTGDLVNGGPDSLAVLRFVQDLGKQAVTVLGNQELRLLGIAEGVIAAQPDDAFDDILAAPERKALLKWLSQCPFLHHDLGYTVVHAGIPAEWSLSQAQVLAMEAESSLSMGAPKAFLENIFADDPTRWHAKHRGWKRVRFITNAFTRMRYLNDGGRLDFSEKGRPGTQAAGYEPWYRAADRVMATHKIIFGHWAVSEDDAIAGIFPLDTGCGRGGGLTALAMTPAPEKICVPAISR